MKRSNHLMLVVLAGLLVLSIAWIYHNIYSVGSFSVLLIWYLFSLADQSSLNKFVRLSPYTLTGLILSGLALLYYLETGLEGVLFLLFLGFTGIAFLSYAVFQIHRALLPLFVGIMWLSLMYWVLAGDWADNTLFSILAMGIPCIILIVYAIHLLRKAPKQ